MVYVAALAAISCCVIVHELGHLGVAKCLGIPVARFSIGFGPRLAGRRWGGTEYRLSLLPLGGYVLPAAREAEEFLRLPPLKRVAFALGGPAANVVLAVTLFVVINILTVGFSWQAITLDPLAQTIAAAGKIARAFAGLLSAPQQAVGVVGMVTHGAQLGLTSILGVLGFTLTISLNLAFFNLLPLPPLDGGKILVAILEKIHPGWARAHLPVSIAGAAILLLIFAYVTVLDVLRCVGTLACA